MTGMLYLVPNALDFGTADAQSAPADLQEVLPLGVLRIAARLSCWVAENAKTTRAFLKRVDAVVPLAQPLQSLQIVELPRPQKGAKVQAPAGLDALLAPALQGLDIGLISEAGLPAVADPGAALVQAAHGLGIPVVALPGPSSLLLALSASGLNGQSFAFVGYLPVEAAERTSRIRDLEALSRRQGQTQLVIETPYRNEALLAALLATLSPQTRLSVSCGLTLPQGWSRTDTVARWKAAPRSVPKDVPAVFSLLAS
ncbi:SAM-dependent methyltransferase [Piscinibacter sp.]|uniref:SAM-dependent methyltransferase n=1 Tax=Piscinibacter sp. TaxID=1903157 RepID=UPI002B6BD45C|nr:SAM-dependent methyltransferase [Albitalea sp.]HUG21236.1 SAM-dependent methyltransferase [Albitalea sp.]